MPQHYSDPRRESEPHALPDLEVWYVTEKEARDAQDDSERDDATPTEPGWYWWPCFPGCLPDGDPSGPFATEAEALADAREGVGDDE